MFTFTCACNSHPLAAPRWGRGARRSTCEPHPAPAQDVLHLQAELTLTGASFARGPPRHGASPTHHCGARVAGLTDGLWVARRTTSFQRTHTLHADFAGHACSPRGRPGCPPRRLWLDFRPSAVLRAGSQFLRQSINFHQAARATTVSGTVANTRVRPYRYGVGGGRRTPSVAKNCGPENLPRCGTQIHPPREPCGDPKRAY